LKKPWINHAAQSILVDGATADLSGKIIDDSLNALTWWTERHIGCVNREVINLLNFEYGLMVQKTVADICGGQQAGVSAV
jgi:hypothetical protein